ncbi:MAG: hypothetical protein WBN42_11675 [Ignavibacteriaceae bacterium]
MKFFKSFQKVVITVLVLLLVICCFMIIRLESKTASIISQWDEHQKSLNKNEDVLSKLDVFSRFVKKNSIKVDGSNILLLANNTWVTIGDNDFDVLTNGNIKLGSNTDDYLGYDSQKKVTYINYDGAQVSVGDIKLAGKQYNGVLVRSSNGKTQIVLTDKGLYIGAAGNTDEYRIELRPEKDILMLNKGKSELVFEKDNVKLQVDGDIQIGPSSDKYIGYKTNEDRFYIHHSNSEIFLGPIYDKQQKLFASGIYLRGKSDGPYLTVNERNLRLVAPMKNGLYDITIDPENNMLGINCGKSFIVIEKDNIKIDTPGDINITSTNGNVNIKGKKVSLNE